MKLFIDDVREPSWVFHDEYATGWTIARTAKDAIRLLLTGTVTEVSFDHDLGSTEPGTTGYDAMLVMEQAIDRGHIPCPEFIGVHTANPSAAQKMWACANRLNGLQKKRED